ncbi:MAG: hypothetical protein R2787_16450 [Saprospiraceae bacterium]
MFRLMSAIVLLFLVSCQPGTPPAEQVAGDWQGALGGQWQSRD